MINCTVADLWYGEDPMVKPNQNVLADFRDSCAAHDMRYQNLTEPNDRGKYCTPLFHTRLLSD